MRVERWLGWLAGASLRERQLLALAVLGLLFTLLGGFGAAGRFWVQMAAEYHLLVGEANLDLPEGQAALARAAALRPRWARPHLDLALVFYREGWFDGARREAEHAFTLAEDDVEKSRASYLAALAHEGLGEPGAALEALKLAVELDRHNARARSRLEQLQRKDASNGRPRPHR